MGLDAGREGVKKINRYIVRVPVYCLVVSEYATLLTVGSLLIG